MAARARGPAVALAGAWLAALGAALSALYGATQEPPASAPAAAARPRIARRDVLLVTLDTTRRDYLGCYGRAPSRTPNLDYLAARSLLFEDAVATVPLTLPSHASLFTGLYPTSHGVRYNYGFKLPDEARSLAEVLRDAGYATRAAVASFVLDPVFGLDQGFDRYRAPLRAVARPDGSSFDSLPAATIVDRVLEDVGELAPAGGPPDGVRKPFFAWAHFYDAHVPYQPKRPPKLEPAVAQDLAAAAKVYYEACIGDIDAELGRLFRELAARKLMDDLVVVVTADHGESLGEAIEPTHGFFLYDPSMRIPLIVRHPDLQPAEVALPVSLIDVAPTLLSLLGIAPPGGPQDGIDLAPWLIDPSREAPDRALIIESLDVWLNFGWAPHFGATKGPIKYLVSAREELYDRDADPTESRNLFVAGDPRAAGLRRQIEAYLAAASPLASARTAMSEVDRARLEALGYAADGGGAAELPADWTTLPDAIARFPHYERMNAAFQSVATQGIEPALAEARAALAEESGSVALREQIALLLATAGPARRAEAAAEFDAALALDGRRPRCWYGRAKCAQQEAEAQHALAKACRDRGDNAAARPHVQAERRELELAETALRRALDCDPRYPDALSLLARLVTLRGDRSAQRKEKAAAEKAYAEVDSLLARLVETIPSSAPEWANAKAQRLRLAQLRKELAEGK